MLKSNLNAHLRAFIMHVTPAINTPEINQMEANAEEQRNVKCNQGKKEAYALHGTKPSGTFPRRVKPCGMNRMSCFGDCKRLPKSSSGITSKVKRENKKCSKCAWRERAGQETRGLGVTRKSFYEQQQQHELMEQLSHSNRASALNVNSHCPGWTLE